MLEIVIGIFGNTNCYRTTNVGTLLTDSDFSPFGKYTDRLKDRSGIRVLSHEDYVRMSNPQGFSLFGQSSLCVKERFTPRNQNKSNKKQKKETRIRES
jgi:hypothetical protein